MEFARPTEMKPSDLEAVLIPPYIDKAVLAEFIQRRKEQKVPITVTGLERLLIACGAIHVPNTCRDDVRTLIVST